MTAIWNSLVSLASSISDVISPKLLAGGSGAFILLILLMAFLPDIRRILSKLLFALVAFFVIKALIGGGMLDSITSAIS
ncbi:hypothetical protein [Eubacterium oxidoreducens]|uniref:Uncharacterized protein n=1 Tax=Eubacterium oxidoreducens TaxID=1732 RepID=A0A1G6C3X3_EUBOX|nr:hypothetical protein [Eubacterium oxidoreducens]SDB27592.1 hypothetical protein SAMN02910417_02051 [Eubacterium oxidoreducens]